LTVQVVDKVPSSDVNTYVTEPDVKLFAVPPLDCITELTLTPLVQALNVGTNVDNTQVDVPDGKHTFIVFVL
jgi:hypothetical protein